MIFVSGSVDFEGCSKDIMYFFFSVYFRYIDLVHGSCDHLTYIVLIFFIY